ncbi:hypothetical protein HW555_010011 [Spodoptera exigua]|uniref:PiggyBac transposable element-derived protein domain-containing protein n=1 Tax=Spodoptera exigua TaxID=7107 RepID=A0A835GBZ6_SPOEX|nr:hypothetical protein HW555_010011 [Spodoptera exigua]
MRSRRYLEKSAIEYFKLFLSDDIVSHIVEQTNIYSTQINGTSVNIKEDDVKTFWKSSGIWESLKCMHIQIIGLKFYADIMTLKKFQLLRRYLHFNDNLKDDGDTDTTKIRENCLQVEEETRFSTDEMMKWGYKIFVRAGVSVVYDFLIYGGGDTFRFHFFTEEENSMGLGAKVVLALTKSIYSETCMQNLCFDKFFRSIELLQYLRDEYGVFALGTIRANRLREAEKKLPTDKNFH